MELQLACDADESGVGKLIVFVWPLGKRVLEADIDKNTVDGPLRDDLDSMVLGSQCKLGARIDQLDTGIVV